MSGTTHIQGRRGLLACIFHPCVFVGAPYGPRKTAAGQRDVLLHMFTVRVLLNALKGAKVKGQLLQKPLAGASTEEHDVAVFKYIFYSF